MISKEEQMSASYTTGVNDSLGGFLPHLDLSSPTAIDVAQTALGAGKTMAELSTAMNDSYYRLLLKNSDAVVYKAEGFLISIMLTYELQLLTSKFVFRSEKYSEGQRLRLVLRGSADLFTLEEALLHCGIGIVAGTLTDDYSSDALKIQNNQALANAGLPMAIYCNQSYAGVVISQSGNGSTS